MEQDVLAAKLWKRCCNWTAWTFRNQRKSFMFRIDVGTCTEAAESCTPHQSYRMELHSPHLNLLKSFDLHEGKGKMKQKNNLNPTPLQVSSFHFTTWPI